MSTNNQTKAELLKAQKDLTYSLGANLYFASRDLIESRTSKHAWIRDEKRARRMAVDTAMGTLRFLRQTQPELFAAVILEARKFYRRERERRTRQAAALVDVTSVAQLAEVA